MGRKMIWKSCAASVWRRWSPTIRWGFSQRSYHQKFQVPKMEGFLNLIRLFWRWGFPYITLTYCLYRWGFLHFRYLKCLVMVSFERKNTPDSVMDMSRLNETNDILQETTNQHILMCIISSAYYVHLMSLSIWSFCQTKLTIVRIVGGSLVLKGSLKRLHRQTRTDV